MPKIKTKVGFRGRGKDIEVTIAPDDPPPWGLDAPLKVVGTDVQRLDGVLKVTGRAKYTYDQQPPGMLWGKILHSPWGAATIKSLDVGAAKRVPGVRAVHVFKEGKTFYTGRLEGEPGELRGIKEALGVRSTVGVPLEVGGHPRGILMLASQKPEFFTPDDVRYLQSIASWIGLVAHRAELAEQIGRNAVEAGRRAGAEEMITVLAHDLRNYLSPISARLETLRLRAEQENRAADAGEAIGALRSLKRLADLVSEILDVARIDQGLFQLRMQPVDLGQLTAAAAGELSSAEQPVQVTASVTRGRR